MIARLRAWRGLAAMGIAVVLAATSLAAAQAEDARPGARK
jgi:hypothetical protein